MNRGMTLAALVAAVLAQGCITVNAFTPGSFIDLMFLRAAPGMWVTCLDLSTPWLRAASEIPIVAAAMPAAIPSVLSLSMIHP